MSRLHPGHERRRERLLAVLIVVGGVLTMVATFLNAWPLPFRVPPALVFLPGCSGSALFIVALVLVLRELPRLPW